MLPLSDNASGLSAADARDAVEALAAGDAAAPARARRGLASLRDAVLGGDRDATPVSPGASASASIATAPMRVAAQLRGHCDPETVVLLHHRAASDAVPRLDHLAVGPSGVWVVHSRDPKGRVEIREPMFGRTKLTIGGRERMDLLLTLEQQWRDVVSALVTDHPAVEVRSALCFADTPPPLHRSLYLGSYLFFGAEALAAHLTSEGPLSVADVRAVAASLEASFPPA